MKMKKFMIGSAQVSEDVLKRMAIPLLGHADEKIPNLQERIIFKLKKLFNTDETILLSSFSGSGLMEGALRSCTGKRAAIFSIGKFGKVWYKIAVSNNIPVDLYEVALGEAINAELVDEVLSTGKYDVIAITHNETSTGVMNPIKDISKVIKKYPEVVWCLDAISSLGGTKVDVDKLGIDICIASTEKALALPTGMSMCSVSQKAIDRLKKIPYRGYCLDLLNIYDCMVKNQCRYSVTPSISNLYGLDYQLDKIDKEGLENRYQRHNDMSKTVKNWANENLKVFGNKKYLSNTVTIIENTRNINLEKLNAQLNVRGFAISNGCGKLRNKTFGIGHMGDSTVEDIKELLKNIEDIIS